MPSIIISPFIGFENPSWILISTIKNSDQIFKIDVIVHGGKIFDRITPRPVGPRERDLSPASTGKDKKINRMKKHLVILVNPVKNIAELLPQLSQTQFRYFMLVVIGCWFRGIFFIFVSLSGK